MRLYEYEAKQIFSEYNIPLPQEKLVFTPGEAESFASELAKPVVLKSQILSGGRGKAGGRGQDRLRGWKGVLCRGDRIRRRAPRHDHRARGDFRAGAGNYRL